LTERSRWIDYDRRLASVGAPPRDNFILDVQILKCTLDDILDHELTFLEIEQLRFINAGNALEKYCPAVSAKLARGERARVGNAIPGIVQTRANGLESEAGV
jgi:hypothetical protein